GEIRAAVAALHAARAGPRLWHSAPPEPAPPARELVERGLEGLAREVRPQLVAEDELRIGPLPEQVVAGPLLAAGADDQVGIVHLGGVEQLAERLFAAAR